MNQMFKFGINFVIDLLNKFIITNYNLIII